MNYTTKIKAAARVVCMAIILFSVSAYIGLKRQTSQNTQVKILNKLIQANIDRIAAYETASRETKELYLKKLFTRFANTSRACKEELDMEVLRLEGEPVKGTNTTLKIYQIWMGTKSMLSNHDVETILSSCDFGEQISEDIYGTTISKDSASLESRQLTMIYVQIQSIKAEHNRVIGLQNLMSINY